VRRAFILVLVAVVLAITWLRGPAPKDNGSQRLRFVPVAIPPAEDLAAHLGPFRLEAVWQMKSPNSAFGGYSALVALPEHRFLAVADRGRVLWFSPPDAPQSPPLNTGLMPDPRQYPMGTDAESATRDPATGTIWIAYEGENGITRHAPGLKIEAAARPPGISRWPENRGAETMVRLADGRFLVVAEAFAGCFETRRHEALLFSGDPTQPDAGVTRFFVDGPDRFSPTDAAQLPDGRVLMLMRRPVWPLPVRFAGRIALFDPADIRPGKAIRASVVAKLSSSLPVDNLEGIAIEPRADGQVTVWLISDDNGATFQRTLLWKLSLDPARLAPTRKGAEPSPAP